MSAIEAEGNKIWKFSVKHTIFLYLGSLDAGVGGGVVGGVAQRHGVGSSSTLPSANRYN